MTKILHTDKVMDSAYAFFLSYNLLLAIKIKKGKEFIKSIYNSHIVYNF